MDDAKLAWRFADCQQFHSFAAVLESLALLKNERKVIIRTIRAKSYPNEIIVVSSLLSCVEFFPGKRHQQNC